MISVVWCPKFEVMAFGSLYQFNLLSLSPNLQLDWYHTGTRPGPQVDIDLVLVATLYYQISIFNLVLKCACDGVYQFRSLMTRVQLLSSSSVLWLWRELYHTSEQLVFGYHYIRIYASLRGPILITIGTHASKRGVVVVNRGYLVTWNTLPSIQEMYIQESRSALHVQP